MQYLNLEEYIDTPNRRTTYTINNSELNILFQISIQQKLDYPLEALHLLFQTYQIP